MNNAKITLAFRYREQYMTALLTYRVSLEKCAFTSAEKIFFFNCHFVFEVHSILSRLRKIPTLTKASGEHLIALLLHLSFFFIMFNEKQLSSCV